LETLQKLKDKLSSIIEKGCDIIFLNGANLAIINIPYITSSGEIKLGVLVEPFILKGLPIYTTAINPITQQPQKLFLRNAHTIYFDGEFPCDLDFDEMSNIVFPNATQIQYAPGRTTKYMMSSRPQCGYYDDHVQKIITYFDYISDPAFYLMKQRNIDLDDLKKKNEFDVGVEHQVFIYPDFAPNSIFVNSLSPLFQGKKIAIIGVGGTGSYILDLISRTPIEEIHLFDFDDFDSHSAYRAPGIYNNQVVQQKMNKAQLHSLRYSQFRYNIEFDIEGVNESNLSKLEDFDFVFICIDAGEIKHLIIDFLVANSVPFIDSGISVDLVQEKMLVVTNLVFFDGQNSDFLQNHITYFNDEENPYDSNIQVAEINSLVACQAVIKWKQFIGFYHDDVEDNTICSIIHKGVYKHVKN
jgi:hypothetical protein